MYVINFHVVYFIYVLTKVFCYLYFNFSLIRDDSIEELIDNFVQKIDESPEGMVDFIDNCPLLYRTAKETSFVHDSSLVTSGHTEATIHDINHFLLHCMFV